MKDDLEIKLSYIPGLRDVVMVELGKYPDFTVTGEGKDCLYLAHTDDLDLVKQLRSVSRAYLVMRDDRYHPRFISKHKSVVRDLVEVIIEKSERNTFKSFKITCAGSDSPEVSDIQNYLKEVFKIDSGEDVDLEIHIIKIGDLWEVGAQITPRPLSVREYKVKSMSGAMDPTIAYAVNSLGKPERAESYLNAFVGSATLLIEAAQCYPNLNQLVGFDNSKPHLSIGVQNIKKAGLIDRIQLKEGDIYEKPRLGTFDVITADLPFGMSISKGENLEDLYKTFVGYCEETLNPGGRLVAYTSEHELLENSIAASKFRIVKTLELKLVTSVDAYLYPKIFVCELT